jgi:2-methylisocitrate lyase-like PEP mutase family enzyme
MTESTFTIFKSLHYASSPFLLPNAWDAASAALLQLDGSPAVATSSAALAWSLGYADGGSLPRAELMSAIRRIARVITVPLTVDLEDGYNSDPSAVADLVAEVYECGACGVNLEDGAGSPELLAQKIAVARKTLTGKGVFINARSDVYLRELASGDAAITMAIDRLLEYQAAGADGVFVPGLAETGATACIAEAVKIPLNLMMIPGMQKIDQLFAMGARRFTLGPALFQSAYGHGRAQVRRFLQKHEVDELFTHDLPYAFMNTALQPAN